MKPPGTTHKEFNGRLLAAALLSFVLYAAAVISQHHDRNSHWSVEAYDVISGAISHVVYGRPIGAIDIGVRSTFLAHQDKGIEIALSTAAKGSVTSSVDPVAKDGIGAGSVLFTTIAMSLFGTH